MKEKEQAEKAHQNPYSLLHKDDEEVCMEEESVIFTAKITSNEIMEGLNLTIILVLLLILFSSMDFKHKIIQWNCRGLKPNYNEVSLLISEYNPSVFCFQETFLKPDDNISLRGFNICYHLITRF